MYVTNLKKYPVYSKYSNNGVSIISLPLSYMILARPLNLTEPWFPPLPKGNDTHLTVLLEG